MDKRSGTSNKLSIFCQRKAGRSLKHCQNFQDSYNQQGKETEHSNKTIFLLSILIVKLVFSKKLT